jgi:hypothetical protein
MITRKNFFTFIVRHSLFIGIPLIALSLTGTIALFHFSQASSPPTVAYAANSSTFPALPIPMHDSTGCPDTVDPVSKPPSPDVVILPAQANTTIIASTGDTIEVRLPFEMQWNGPTTSQYPLEIQPPAGYISQTNSACIWRFLAEGSGTTLLTFTGQALCGYNQMCPQYIIGMSFTIDIN